jgi:hypothetical protein
MIAIAERSKALVCGRSSEDESEVLSSIPGAGMVNFFCECYMLSGRGLCDEQTTLVFLFFGSLKALFNIVH